MPAAEPIDLATAPGFRGIWYGNRPLHDARGFKYSGGLGTYPQQHGPIAVHAPQVGRTFFVYGGDDGEPDTTPNLIAYYDHQRHTVARPRLLLTRGVRDAHENPVLCIAGDGRLVVFSPGHGSARKALIHRSVRPYDITAFERVAALNTAETTFAYPQPWWVGGEDGGQIALLHTRYVDGVRTLCVNRSPDGVTWEPWAGRQVVADMLKGQYQVSTRRGRTLATAFNIHPPVEGSIPLNHRTNLYCLLSDDAGRNWRTAAGDPADTPLREPDDAALVRDYRAEGKLVYLKDTVLDADGRPAILHVLSDTAWPGEGGPRVWRVARWTGGAWAHSDITTSDHNYDYGTLAIEGERWRMLGCTEPGPQPGATGGEIALWLSDDSGATWRRDRLLTAGSTLNPTYPRKVEAAADAFAYLWADGNPLTPSESSLYFTDRPCSAVWRLPRDFGDGEQAVEPELVNHATRG